MSYEFAPATRLVATHCAHCGKALVDATSVEIGLGPVCRKRVEWDALGTGEIPAGSNGSTFAIGIPEADARIETLVAAGDARAVANFLVYVAAALQGGDEALLAILGVKRLGFVKLAAILFAHVAGVEIKVEPGKLFVRAPYDERLPIARRSVPCPSYFDGKRRAEEEAAKTGNEPRKPSKNWVFESETADVKRAVLKVLRACFPQAPIVTPAAIFFANGLRVALDGSRATVAIA